MKCPRNGLIPAICPFVFAGAFVLLVAGLEAGLRGTPDEKKHREAALSGGDTTVFLSNKLAYSRPLANLPAGERPSHLVGNSFFNLNWVTAPASAEARDGLGPLFQARSCSACHLRDGRGRPPVEGEKMLSMLMRLSVPGKDAHGGPLPHPVYGGQLAERSLDGAAAEGRTEIAYEEVRGTFGDGSAYALRKPSYAIRDFGYGEDGTETLLTSPRVAPSVFGLGLLAAIPEETILASADPDDEDGDGISGRPNHVWDVEKKAPALGRFGWKANQPTLRQQAAGAFNGDMGITTSLFPDENHTAAQASAFARFPSGGTPEVSDAILRDVERYLLTLAPPARRHVEDPRTRRGEKLFTKIDCAKCHAPELRTGAFPDLDALANQTIRPYTDLLLHDMGAGLADHRPDFEATGSEWRTPPLWGIGLQKTVNGHTFFLHDGRARNLTEAILWHGGEAEASREKFRNLSASERADVLAFLNAL